MSTQKEQFELFRGRRRAWQLRYHGTRTYTDKGADVRRQFYEDEIRG